MSSHPVAVAYLTLTSIVWISGSRKINRGNVGRDLVDDLLVSHDNGRAQSVESRQALAAPSMG